jgi:hypothetical protein
MIALFFALGTVGAQETSSSEDTSFDVDSLFEGDETTEEETEEEQEPAEEETEEETSKTPLLERVQEETPSRLGGNFRFIAGYSPGISEMLGKGGEYSPLAIVEISSLINLLFTVSPVLEVSNKFKFTYPEFEFKITELAMDYDIQDWAYLNLGLKRINWGRSPNFSFANIIHREADNPLGTVDDLPPFIGRVVIPIGVGGFEFLIQNKAEYHENGVTLSGKGLGIGAKYNFARERIDITLGGYYQRGLKGRVFLNGTTTITDWLEMYAEGVYVDARLRGDDTGPYADEEEPTTASGEPIKDGWIEIAPDIVRYDNNPDFGASIGFVVGLFENNFEFNGEYYYNGEEAENEIDGARFPIFWGHNIALNTDLTIPKTPLRLRMGYRFNNTLNSHFFLLRLTIDPWRHVTMDVIGGLVGGPDNAGYGANNPDELNRPAFLSFTITVHGKI